MDLLTLCSVSNIKDFAGNRFLVRKLFENVQNGTSVIIFGPTGCGKTTLCRIFKTQIDFQSVFEVTRDNFTSCKDLVSHIKTFVDNKSIASYFSKGKCKRVIIIDDYDVLLNTDKTLQSIFVNDIIPMLQRKNVQLIMTCITDFQTKKKLQESVKSIECVKLTHPSPKEAYAFLVNMLDERIEGKEERLLQMVNKYKGAIREALLHLDSSEDGEYIGVNFRDLNTFEIVRKMFNSQRITHDDIMYIYRSDASNIMYLLYENLPDELCHRDAKKAQANYLKMLNYFVSTAEMETYAYNATEWKIFEWTCYLRLQYIKNALNECAPVKGEQQQHQLRYTQLLSKISHKNILAKKIENIQKRNQLPLDDIFQLVDRVVKDDALADSIKKTTDDSTVVSTYKKYFL
jgi:energy-coupling factor transporter ATP-binding protein EcfA2